MSEPTRNVPQNKTVAKTKAVGSTALRTYKICQYMTELDISPKQFMVTFLSSSNEDISYCRRLMRAGLGPSQTRSIVKNLGQMTMLTPKGRDHWEELILEEASSIVNRQDLPQGSFPTGAYTSSNQIDPDYFSEGAESHREGQVSSGMKFLHTLIHRKIQHAMQKNKSHGNHEIPDNIGPQGSHTTAASSNQAEEVTVPDEDLSEADEIDSSVLSLDSLVCVKQSDADLAATKLAKIPILVCAMIANACNRRSNAIPLANGLMAYSGGVSCRINACLHAYGMSTSRQTILQAMEHLRILQEHRMMEVFKVNYKLLPLLCFDNVDIHLRIHNTRIETSSRLFHGTWGFFIVIRACLQAKCTQDAVSLAAFLDAMAAADRKSVQMSTFCPGPHETKHWRLVIKAQLAKCVKEYVEHLPGAPDPNHLPLLDTRPPAIDAIEMHKPNIHFLRMMDAPDSSAEGVWRVLGAVMAQIGVEKEAYAGNLLVAGGDVGSNQLVESLRVKHFPPVTSFEGLEWVLSIFGGAHTTWHCKH